MYTEDELLPVSGLQHLAFCERQVALIHIEGLWEENVYTAEGKILHEHAHEEGSEAVGDLRIARGLRLRSLRLGLVGAADVVEFHRVNNLGVKTSVELPGVKGRWQPYIVEYKRGMPKLERTDEVQLCAQAMCLEEMLDIEIPSSAFFYGKPRRRDVVNLDSSLREETTDTARHLHALIDSGKTPVVSYSAKCEWCSLMDTCLPKMPRGRTSVENYLRNVLSENEGK
jgi:CRISPR-associated exonuclease Cas4